MTELLVRSWAPVEVGLQEYTPCIILIVSTGNLPTPHALSSGNRPATLDQRRRTDHHRQKRSFQDTDRGNVFREVWPDIKTIPRRNTWRLRRSSSFRGEFMNVEQAIADLRLQLKVVNQLIITFERLAANGKRRRGRPPKWLNETRSRLNTLPERKEKRI